MMPASNYVWTFIILYHFLHFLPFLFSHPGPSHFITSSLPCHCGENPFRRTYISQFGPGIHRVDYIILAFAPPYLPFFPFQVLRQSFKTKLITLSPNIKESKFKANVIHLKPLTVFLSYHAHIVAYVFSPRFRYYTPLSAFSPLKFLYHP